MAYWVKVDLLRTVGGTAVYEVGRDGVVDRHVGFDAAAGTFFPSDEHGTAVSEMRLSVDSDTVTDPDPDVDLFVQAVAGLVREWRPGEAPPRSGTRYFG